MSNFFKQINGVFTISIDGKPHPNLVVATGLSNIFADTQITSLCDTLKVFNDEAEVQFSDTDYLSPVATSSNVTDTQFGVTGDGVTDYFFMKKTWTFFQGQIKGIINKLAVYSDDGTLYAAALLKNEAGELDPVRPLFAPKVEITYESRWHFKQDANYTTGTPVYFSEAGMVVIKTNMADKNDPVTYENMNKPFRITDVELFSDAITTNDAAPTVSLGKVDETDYTIQYVNGEFGAYGQYLNILLPKDKYINDTPIASMVVTTSRGKWQVGFEDALEKPTLSKREISLTIPFVHGSVTQDGEFELTGNPDAINSIFSELVNSMYNISVREVTYDGTGTSLISPDGVAAPVATPAYFGALKTKDKDVTIIAPTGDTLLIVAGPSSDVESYLDGNVSGIVLELAAGEVLVGTVDATPISDSDFTASANDAITLTASAGTLTLTNRATGSTYTTAVSSNITELPDHLFVGIKDVEQDTQFTIY